MPVPLKVGASFICSLTGTGVSWATGLNYLTQDTGNGWAGDIHLLCNSVIR
jgi:hypothetical protein